MSDSLEKQVAQLRAEVSALRAELSKAVVTEGITLVDQDGRTRATLNVDNGCVRLELLNDAGSGQIGLSVSPVESLLTISDDEGIARIGPLLALYERDTKILWQKP